MNVVEMHLNCRCLLCLLLEHKHKGMVLTYDRYAYAVVLEVVALAFSRKHRESPTTEEVDVSAAFILDSAMMYGAKLMGPMAGVVFELLGIRTAKDMGRIIDDLKAMRILKASDADLVDFNRHDFNFLTEFAKPEPKGAT